MSFRPKASDVLTAYLKQKKEPPWTSYFVKYSSVINDQFVKYHFNWKVNNSNYHILRTGCFPYMKYHCTKRPTEDLTFDDTLMGVIKIINLGKTINYCSFLVILLNIYLYNSYRDSKSYVWFSCYNVNNS